MSKRPISGADRIECVTVLGWEVVVRKDRFSVGESVIYIFPDTMVPTKFIDGDTPQPEGYDPEKLVRLKTLKIRGEYSAGLILPLSYLEDLDISDLLNICKYITPTDVKNGGKTAGEFPSRFVPKTDEFNYRSYPEAFEESEKFTDVGFVATMKLDGTSATYIRKGDEKYCCSRNYILEDEPNQLIWHMNRELRILDQLERSIFI